MAITAVGDLITALRQSKLLEARQLNELAAHQARFQDPRELAKFLIKKGLLTTFQATQLLQGRGQDLVLGQYRLLDRLGEGGMGQVFKARHQSLDRLVAIKVIRRDVLSNPNAVRRFQQEIKAAAKLLHPNIVMAFDADQVGSTHFFVMEYVDGVDLSKLVKDKGPLPIGEACEYIRQAALGLQHAHECGLVHRDIKPANLLVAGGGNKGARDEGREASKGESLASRPSSLAPVVKILDMGLARLRQSADENLSRLTQEGTVIGTPDYMAPEQAADSASIDIRADLYSLGCTFYFLLTGQAPFPGGTIMEKLLKHRSETPTPAERLRPDIPREVLIVLHKLLAKNPQDRYQTPAEAAQTLAGLVPTVAVPAAPILSGSQKNAAAPMETIVAASTGVTVGMPTVLRLGKRRWLRYLLVGVVAFFVGVFALAVIVSKMRKPPSQDKPDVGKIRESEPSPLDQIDLDKVHRTEDQPLELVKSLTWEDGAKPLCVRFSPDGKRLVMSDENNYIRFWNLADWREVVSPKLEGSVRSLAFHPNGKSLASGGDDGWVRLWDVYDGELRRQDEWRGHRREDKNDDVVVFSRDGRYLATAGADRSIRVWDLDAARPLKSVALRGNGDSILALSFAPNEMFLVSADREGAVHLWDLTDLTKDAPEEALATWSEHSEAVLALAFAPDGKTLASAGRDNLIFLREMDGSAQRRMVRLRQHTAAVQSLAFSPNGKKLVSAGEDGLVVVWDVASRVESHKWQFDFSVRSVAFAPDGRHVATANDNGSVYILRLPPAAR